MLKKTLPVFLLLAALPAGSVLAANIYRYKDNNGNVFLGSQVPAEYAKNGYEVIDEKGKVIQEVSRALTAAELAARQVQEEEQQVEVNTQQAQEEADLMLLRLYRSPEEVVRRRDSTTEELDAQMETLSVLLREAQRKVDSLQETADTNVTAGREVPENIATQLETATEERDRLTRQVNRIETEKAEVLATAEKNIERLKVLLNID